jgi:hypothetical protein
LFFELSDCIKDSPSKYFAVYDAKPPSDTKIPPRYHGLAANSERIWCEDEWELYFIKNRLVDPKLAIVDTKELLLVKLKSIAV